jgi:hypothetical protein
MRAGSHHRGRCAGAPLVRSIVGAVVFCAVASGCRTRSLIGSPVESILGAVETPNGRLEYACVVHPTSSLPKETPIGGCMRRESLRFAGNPTLLGYGEKNALCAVELSRCSLGSAELLTRDDGANTLVVIDASTDDALHAVYATPRSGLVFRWKSVPRGEQSARELLDEMPSLEDAIARRVASSEPISPRFVGATDHLWPQLASARWMRPHLAGVTERVRRCAIGNDTPSVYLEAAGSDGLRELYRVSKRIDCKFARDFLEDKRPEGLAALVLLDLEDGKPAAFDASWVLGLAAAIGTPELTRGMLAKLDATKLDSTGKGVVESNKVWFEGIRAVAALDGAAAQTRLIDAFRSANVPPDESRAPLHVPNDGRADAVALLALSTLIDLELAGTKDRISAIASSESNPAGTRRLAHVALAILGDGAVDGAGGFAFSPQQRASVEGARARRGARAP